MLGKFARRHRHRFSCPLVGSPQLWAKSTRHGVNSHLPTSASTAPHRVAWLILLVSLLVATTAAPSSASEAEEAGFSDSSDAGSSPDGGRNSRPSWAYFEGTECDTDMFCPNDPMKRWVMAVWLVRVLGHKPLNTDTSQFADVEADEWWSPYAERLAKLKVTAGCKTEPLRYCPDSSVTRAQMAAFLVRAFDLEESPPAGFVDTEESVHSANIDALAAAGITSGCKTDPLSYCPDRPVTRAQMATFLHRAISTSDRAILAALYHATGGPKWSARTKWLSNTPIGQWFGVSTNRDGNVYLLDLRGNGLKGFLPPVLGNLAHPSDLRLGDNELTGPIPEELSKLEQLAGLDLSSNKLTRTDTRGTQQAQPANALPRWQRPDRINPGGTRQHHGLATLEPPGEQLDRTDSSRTGEPDIPMGSESRG